MAMTATPTSAEPGVRRLPSRLMVNLYLIVGIGLLIVSGIPETNTLVRYAIGIAAEIVLVILALVFMRIERLRVPETARLKRPGAIPTLLALAAVPGLWVSGIVINLVAVLLFGYTTPAPPAQFPANLVEALALALTTMVIAPLAEEFIFRGYVQRAYERRSIWTGILVGGLIFAIYHLRFQGVFALIPVALGLGYVAWRTESIYPSILMHAAYNSIATFILISTSLLPLEVTGALTGVVACLGFLVTPLSFVALWLLWRTTAPVRLAPTPRPRRRWRWAWALPLAALLALYGYVAVSEVLTNRFPERVLNDAIALAPPDPWDEPVRLRYAVQTPLGSDLGEAICDRRSEEAAYVLTCEADYEGYDITDEIPELTGLLEDLDFEDLPLDIPGFQSMLRADPGTWMLEAAWTRTDLDLAALDVSGEVSATRPFALQYAAEQAADAVTAEGPDTGTTTLDLPTGTPRLMLHEWAWRLAALPFELPYGGPVTVVWTDPEMGPQVADGFLRVAGGEPMRTPAGSYVTWRVNVTWEDGTGDEQMVSAWYDTESAHTLIRYDDGIVSYLLAGTESAE